MAETRAWAAGAGQVHYSRPRFCTLNAVAQRPFVVAKPPASGYNSQVGSQRLDCREERGRGRVAVQLSALLFVVSLRGRPPNRIESDDGMTGTLGRCKEIIELTNCDWLLSLSQHLQSQAGNASKTLLLLSPLRLLLKKLGPIVRRPLDAALSKTRHTPRHFSCLNISTPQFHLLMDRLL
ncbi:hypothetical protein BCR34DRAFT_191990 [Clohesyomyces aquaticus]|uniref:Uncharacterized protein n=1 Tax=Clohesyomyces aquaticus TaxID=1231657 RepID=A0A1Y1ZY79_9PLEO|nr:hypothetical protein BCR34DRAFT_191990 [Clohesyomyces aquaticus]